MFPCWVVWYSKDLIYGLEGHDILNVTWIAQRLRIDECIFGTGGNGSTQGTLTAAVVLAEPRTHVCG